MLQTQREIKEKARPKKKAKLRRAGTKGGYGEAIEDGSEKWEQCSLLQWPKERRFRLYRAVLAAYSEECIKKPKRQIQEHDEEA